MLILISQSRVRWTKDTASTHGELVLSSICFYTPPSGQWAIKGSFVPLHDREQEQELQSHSCAEHT